jgi:Chromo (CHRromatin Organisation MOdifier) domain
VQYKSIYNVFHVSLLEPYWRRPSEKPNKVVPDIVDSEEQWEVEEILDHKVDWRGGKPKHKYLIQWLGFTLANDQWVDEDDFAEHDIIDEYHQRYPRESPAKGRSRKRRKT